MECEMRIRALSAIAAGFLLLCSSEFSARAATLNPFQSSVSIGAGVTSLHAEIPLGSFTDDFFFNLTAPTSFSAVASVTNSGPLIDPFSIQVWRVGDLSALFGSSSFVVNSGAEFLAAAGILSSPGDYFLRVTGLASAATAIDGNITLSPVPVPGALVLFGSGLLGLIAVNRKRKQKVDELAA
jgi:hypothetical protein